LEPPVSGVWTAVAAVGAGTVALKATGPVLLGGRGLPPRLAAVVALLAPALLAALVVTQAVGGDRELVFDARLAGLAAAVLALRLRAPLLLVVILAAATAALVRLA
jgi:branched-subunit amino acid transport protein